MENRRKPAPPATTLDINCDCKEYVIDYLAKSFPVRLMAVFTDENGNPRSEPMSDEQGAPVLCRSALAARDRMIEQLCALPPIATALDAIIERFGVEQVAEVTGRTRRLIVGRDGHQKLQSRSPRANVAETQAFMDGNKRILVFSDAGGTGRSYHADLAAKNQARRVHFLLEPGWRADAAIQGLGRTNRTNQASAPLFRPVTTDVRGERRFISTIARRLDSLGALTRGQRQTGGQNLFDPADNLESIYAKEALHRWFGLLFTGKLEAVSLGRFQELTGLRIEAPDGSMVDDLPSIQRWLNRILALPIALQNAIFDEFMGLVDPNAPGGPKQVFADGGLWANNPIMVGLVDALTVAPPEQPIEIYSLGTCPRPEGDHLDAESAHRSMLDWSLGADVAPLSISAQEFAFDHMARLLTNAISSCGRSIRRVRFPNKPVPASMMPYLALDDTRPEAMDRLVGQAHSDADLTKSACDDPNSEDGRMIRRLMQDLPVMPTTGAVWRAASTHNQEG